MQRYAVICFSRATGTQVPLANEDTPAGVLQRARGFMETGYTGVSIFDNETLKQYAPDAFAAAHKLK